MKTPRGKEKVTSMNQNKITLDFTQLELRVLATTARHELSRYDCLLRDIPQSNPPTAMEKAKLTWQAILKKLEEKQVGV